MFVLREVEGANKEIFSYVPTGPSVGTLPNGERFTIESAWFDLIGDMHVRFVMDGESTMRNLTAKEFATFGLTPELAVETALRNIHARYGHPKSSDWRDGVMLVSGESPDLDSSYFLDRAFWDALLEKHPDGIVVGVPKRGGLIYAPIEDQKAVGVLKQSIRSLHESSGQLRVSSALYLYKSGKWTVYQRPAPAK